MLAYRGRAGFSEALRDYIACGERDSLRWPTHVHVRSVGRIEQISVDDIMWVEAAGNYVALHLAGRQVLHRMPISRMADYLAPQVFLRVHRGAIVQRSQMSALRTAGDGSYRLVLCSGAEVPVSERYVGAVRDAIQHD